MDNKKWILMDEIQDFHRAVFVKTGNTGKAKVLYPDNYELKLLGNTLVKLRRDIVYIESGNSWFKVERRKSGELYIKTPTAIAGIRGTEFEVQVKDKISDFFVYSGIIEVMTKNLDNKTLLHRSKTLTVRGNILESKPRLFSPVKRVEKHWKPERWKKLYGNSIDRTLMKKIMKKRSEKAVRIKEKQSMNTRSESGCVRISSTRQSQNCSNAVPQLITRISLQCGIASKTKSGPECGTISTTKSGPECMINIQKTRNSVDCISSTTRSGPQCGIISTTKSGPECMINIDR
ncbi:FecR domain-containing protein, partial [bacterium]|nr:FecR domain-containing protein [bacterium]